jgi:hypothetical protein
MKGHATSAIGYQEAVSGVEELAEGRYVEILRPQEDRASG